jgi:hypothetical protein
MNHRYFSLLVTVCLLTACKSTYLAKDYDFPNPVDTTKRPINRQEKKAYTLENGITADNLFDGARLNGFEEMDDDKIRAIIAPENEPINPSPYYAFRLWSETAKNVVVELHYEGAKHRYWPKTSTNGVDWDLLPEEDFRYDGDSTHAFLSLSLSADTLWVAAQELANSTQVRAWCEALAQHPDLSVSSIGKSTLGRDLLLMDIGNSEAAKKDIIVVMSRQHPPETTGYLAMQAFVEEIMADHALAQAFRNKYRILVFPLMNPDGVDLGHWRHNAGGIDLNRDWAYYHQPETRQVADFIVQAAGTNKSEVILGLDFHSTYHDVYYTNKDQDTAIPHFQDYWLLGIQQTIGETINERPSNVSSPVSKNWFLTQFKAVGITYEIGDDTPRDFIQRKGQASAEELMQLLILRGE